MFRIITSAYVNATVNMTVTSSGSADALAAFSLLESFPVPSLSSRSYTTVFNQLAQTLSGLSLSSSTPVVVLHVPQITLPVLSDAATATHAFASALEHMSLYAIMLTKADLFVFESGSRAVVKSQVETSILFEDVCDFVERFQCHDSIYGEDEDELTALTIPSPFQVAGKIVCFCVLAIITCVTAGETVLQPSSHTLPGYGLSFEMYVDDATNLLRTWSYQGQERELDIFDIVGDRVFLNTSALLLKEQLAYLSGKEIVLEVSLTFFPSILNRPMPIQSFLSSSSVTDCL